LQALRQAGNFKTLESLNTLAHRRWFMFTFWGSEAIPTFVEKPFIFVKIYLRAFLKFPKLTAFTRHKIPALAAPI